MEEPEQVFNGKKIKYTYNVTEHPKSQDEVISINLNQDFTIEELLDFKKKVLPVGVMSLGKGGIYSNGYKYSETKWFKDQNRVWYEKETEVYTSTGLDIAYETIVNKEGSKKMKSSNQNLRLKFYKFYTIEFDVNLKAVKIAVHNLLGSLDPKDWKRIHEDAIKSNPYYSHPFPDPNDPRI